MRINLLQNITALVFIVILAILTAVSLLGVWEVFERDVISKSFQTFGMLGFATAIILTAGRFIEGRTQQAEEAAPPHFFRVIRRVTIIVLIIAVSLLAVVGVLAIWEVVADKEMPTKSLVSFSILAFSAFVIVSVCLDREGKIRTMRGGKGFSIGGFIVLIIIFFLLWWAIPSMLGA